MVNKLHEEKSNLIVHVSDFAEILFSPSLSQVEHLLK